MKREIKFREFLNGKFHYWGFTDEGLFKGPITPSVTRGVHNQFTGLNDKNGKDIYEGDMVKIIEAKRRYSVEFKEFTFKLVHAEKDTLGLDWGSIQRIGELGWHIEVVGNIYENQKP